MNKTTQLFKNSLIAGFSLFFALLFLNSCGKSEAERLAIKWCECNQQMGELYTGLDEAKEPEKFASLISHIMIESNNVTECMGGEDKLKALNGKMNAADLQQYNTTRESMCGDLVKKLNKKVVEHLPEPEPAPDTIAVKQDSTTIDKDNEEEEDEEF